jgi:voltage-gated potassium channel Kch
MQFASDKSPEDHAEAFLVCGLGRLGQQCATLLKEFGVRVIGVDISAAAGQSPSLTNLLDAFYAGDCSQSEILKKAGVGRCCAALLVTGDERNNIAGAFMARSLNPQVRAPSLWPRWAIARKRSSRSMESRCASGGKSSTPKTRNL